MRFTYKSGLLSCTENALIEQSFMTSQKVSSDPALQRRVPQPNESFFAGRDVLNSILEFAVTQRIC